MESVESYAHLFAKQTLAEWLRDYAQSAGYDEYARFGCLDWRVNRRGPNWGIWTEYPICVDHSGYSQVWDEVGGDGGPYRDAPPTYDDLKTLGLRPKLIADIAIQHKGQIIYAIEVVHKHPMPARKKDAFEEYGIEAYEVPAQWVLRQVTRPKGLPKKFRV